MGPLAPPGLGLSRRLVFRNPGADVPGAKLDPNDRRASHVPAVGRHCRGGGRRITYRAGGRAALLGCAVVGLGYGIASAHRNEAYQSNLAIWSDTVAKQPDNPFAHNDLGEALFERGEYRRWRNSRKRYG